MAWRVVPEWSKNPLTPADNCIYNNLTIREPHDHGQSHEQHRHDFQDVHRRAPALAEPGGDELLRRRPASAGPEGQSVEHLDRHGQTRPAQVCDILQLDASTLSRNVKPLQAHGWLEVVPEEDARAQPFRLTPQGKRLIEKAVPAWEAAQRQAT